MQMTDDYFKIKELREEVDRLEAVVDTLSDRVEELEDWWCNETN